MRCEGQEQYSNINYFFQNESNETKLHIIWHTLLAKEKQAKVLIHITSYAYEV